MWSSDVSLICAWINCWVNNREAGNLRSHRAHYDVNVMFNKLDMFKRMSQFIWDGQKLIWMLFQHENNFVEHSKSRAPWACREWRFGAGKWVARIFKHTGLAGKFSITPNGHFGLFRAYGYGKPFGFLFSISRYRELFSDIGNWNSRYREINFRYREMIDFPISRNDFRISGIDFPISGNVLHMICRYREINSRYPKIATRQKQVTPPPCNTALPHRPLSTMAPSYTGPICLWRPSLRLQ